MITWGSTYPFDTVKTIMQGSKCGENLKQMEVFNTLIYNYGIVSLYKGLTTTLIRAFFTNAVIFYVNELCQSFFKNL